MTLRTIHAMTDPMELLPLVHFMEGYESFNTPISLILARCLAGDYTVLKLLEESECVGIIIYHLQRDTLHLVHFHARNKVALFFPLLVEWCKQSNVKRLMAGSYVLTPQTAQRLFKDAKIRCSTLVEVTF